MDGVNNPLRAYLHAGERMLWEGQPDVRSYLLRGWYFIPFSLMWGGFAIFWEVGVLTSGAGLFFALWGIPFVLMGLYMIVGRFFVAAREARKTWYGVTSRRILLQYGASGQHFTEIDLDKIPTLQMTQQGGGRGSITFGSHAIGNFFVIPGMPRQQSSVAGMFRTTQIPAYPAFESINDVRDVYESIKWAQARYEDKDPYRRDEPVWGAPPHWPGRGGV